MHRTLQVLQEGGLDSAAGGRGGVGVAGLYAAPAVQEGAECEQAAQWGRGLSPGS